MLKKIDSLLLYIKDVNLSAKFYETLGFSIPKKKEDMFVAALGDFDIHAHDETTVEFKNDSGREDKGAGVFIYIATENIDEYYKSLVDKGLKPSHEPKDWPWGNREFALKDPDGYRLVFYEEIKK